MHQVSSSCGASGVKKTANFPFMFAPCGDGCVAAPIVAIKAVNARVKDAYG